MNQVRLVEMRGRKRRKKKETPKKIFGSLNAPLALGQQQQHLESVRIAREWPSIHVESIRERERPSPSDLG